MEFDWVMDCVLGWFMGSMFILCDGLRWVGSVVWRVGLNWVEEIGLTDNSVVTLMFIIAGYKTSMSTGTTMTYTQIYTSTRLT